MAALPGRRSSSPKVEIEVGERIVSVSNPDRVYFPARGETKLDLVNYYLSVGDGIVRALRDRPCMLHRFPKGVSGNKVHQKRIPHGAPPWLETVRVFFPRYSRTADELCLRVIIDRGSVEVFADDGRIVLSSFSFPVDSERSVALDTVSGCATLTSVRTRPLAPHWNEPDRG